MRRVMLLCHLSAAAISCMVATASAQRPSRHIESRLASLAGAYHQLGQFDGAVLVARQGRILFARAYGEANREWLVPNTIEAWSRTVALRCPNRR